MNKTLQQLVYEAEHSPESERLREEEVKLKWQLRKLEIKPFARKLFYSVCHNHKLIAKVRIEILKATIQHMDLERIFEGFSSFENRTARLKKIRTCAKRIIRLKATQQNKSSHPGRVHQQLEDNVHKLTGLLNNDKQNKDKKETTLSLLNGQELPEAWLYSVIMIPGVDSSGELKKWLANPLIYAKEIYDCADLAIKTYSRKGHRKRERRRWLASYIYDTLLLYSNITPTVNRRELFVEILTATYGLFLPNPENQIYGKNYSNEAYNDAVACIKEKISQPA